jgi:hypothetical protein
MLTKPLLEIKGMFSYELFQDLKAKNSLKSFNFLSVCIYSPLMQGVKDMAFKFLSHFATVEFHHT